MFVGKLLIPTPEEIGFLSISQPVDVAGRPDPPTSASVQQRISFPCRTLSRLEKLEVFCTRPGRDEDREGKSLRGMGMIGVATVHAMATDRTEHSEEILQGLVRNLKW